MANTKGLSQILYLIIAASVLMIAALSLVFMLNDGLSGILDFGETSDVSACENQGAQICSGEAPGSIFNAPSSCLSRDDEGNVNPTPGVSTSEFSINPADEQITCN